MVGPRGLVGRRLVDPLRVVDPGGGVRVDDRVLAGVRPGGRGHLPGVVPDVVLVGPGRGVGGFAGTGAAGDVGLAGVRLAGVGEVAPVTDARAVAVGVTGAARRGALGQRVVVQRRVLGLLLRRPVLAAPVVPGPCRCGRVGREGRPRTAGGEVVVVGAALVERVRALVAGALRIPVPLPALGPAGLDLAGAGHGYRLGTDHVGAAVVGLLFLVTHGEVPPHRLGTSCGVSGRVPSEDWRTGSSPSRSAKSSR
ncbi:hypothetical protein C6361_21080 [Plantactinospora sp. BC1]|nr:hypothetical protein C6361_21080 [Plantactinospora sp. BC1]